MKVLRSIVASMLASALLAGVALGADQRPVVLEFEKQWAAPDYYAGTVEGGGTIEMWLFEKRVIGNTQHFSANVAVTVPNQGALTAVVSGKINFSTGRVALNGTVTSGWLAGSQVHEESQLVDPTTGSFVGMIRIAGGGR